MYNLKITLPCPACSGLMIWRHIAEYNFYQCTTCKNEVAAERAEWTKT